MLQIIKKLLQGIIDDIDAGNSNANEDELMQIAGVLRKYTRKDKLINKYQAYTYLNISRATFDNIGYDLEGESPAYLAGDAAYSLASVVCNLGCSRCKD